MASVAALSTKNPYYQAREVDWTIMRDGYGGEKYIKDKGQAYLPATPGQMAEGMSFGQSGAQLYEAYKMRAVYHELVKPALMAMLGVMHRKDADIELPEKMDPLRDSATFNGEGLCALLQRINEQQMLMGRYGLLLDVKEGADINSMPYLVPYNAESIINWDSSKPGDNEGKRRTKLVVVNENSFVRASGVAWQTQSRYRVFGMSNDIRDIWPDLPGGSNAYVTGVATNTMELPGSSFITPSFGGTTLDEVPFVFIGPRDLVPEPDVPVLMPLARLALAIYRTEADYRQALFMQGQDTLVITGQNATDDGSSKTRVGAFGSIELPKGGTAEYIGADSGGISELAGAIQNDLKRASQLGAQLLSERGNEAEAASALNVRVASRTATLTTVAKVGAAGLQQVLRNAAVWLGADPDKVEVNPNLDFADDGAMAQDLTYLMSAKAMGAPLSKRSIHGWLEKREFTTMTYEEEQAEIDEEDPLVAVPPKTGAPPRGMPPKAPGATPPGKTPPNDPAAAAPSGAAR